MKYVVLLLGVLVATLSATGPSMVKVDGEGREPFDWERVWSKPAYDLNQVLVERNDAGELVRAPPRPLLKGAGEIPGRNERRAVAPRIVGGAEVPDPNPYPWVVGIVCETRFTVGVCTGWLISPQLVISAAHCFCDLPVSWTVHAGRFAYNSRSSEVRDVFQASRSVEYDEDTFRGDMMVLLVDSPFTTVNKFAYLPTANPATDTVVTAAGWGTLTFQGTAPDELHEVDLEVQPDAFCRNLGMSTDGSQICAGVDGGGKDSCQGDSGGPLFVQDDCCYYPRSVVAGITSYGSGCGGLSGAVYASVAHHRSEILQMIALFDADVFYSDSTPYCCDTCSSTNDDIGDVTECSSSPSPPPSLSPSPVTLAPISDVPPPASYGGDSGNGGFSCFSGRSVVHSASGEDITMEKLVVGDRVLAMDSYGVLVYSEVYAFLDRKPRADAAFLQVVTESGGVLEISSEHRIFREEGSGLVDVGAYALRIADRVLLADPETKTAELVAITNVSSIVTRGAYAPATMEGTVVVDNVVASCYALADHHRAHHALAVLRLANAYLPQSLTRVFDKSEGLHWFADVLYSTFGSLL